MFFVKFYLWHVTDTRIKVAVSAKSPHSQYFVAHVVSTVKEEHELNFFTQVIANLQASIRVLLVAYARFNLAYAAVFSSNSYGYAAGFAFGTLLHKAYAPAYS